MKELYQKLSALLESHQQICTFHKNKSSSELLDNFLSQEEHWTIKWRLVSVGKIEIWNFVCDMLIDFFNVTKNLLFSLSIRELYDFLSLTNIFLDIGHTYIPNLEEITLFDCILSLTNEYIHNFKDSQINNLRACLENEEWMRLPLPTNFELSEHKNPLIEYPENYKS